MSSSSDLSWPVRVVIAGAMTVAAVVALVSVTETGFETFELYAAGADLSEDHADLFRLYRAFFAREPDVAGARYWTEKYDSCASLLDITRSFSRSPEFEHRYGNLTDDEYVQRVYRTVLGRQPDPDGEAYWLGLLERGELHQPELMLYIALSSEYKARHPFPSDGRGYGGCVTPVSSTTTERGRP